MFTKKSSKKSSSVEVASMYRMLKNQITACTEFSSETIKSAFVTKSTKDFYDVTIDSSDADAYMLLSLSVHCLTVYNQLSLMLLSDEQKNAVQRFCYDTAHKSLNAAVRVYREQHVDAAALKKAADDRAAKAKAAAKANEKHAALLAKVQAAEAAEAEAAEAAAAKAAKAAAKQK